MSDSTKALLILVLCFIAFAAAVYWLFLEVQVAVEYVEQHGLKGIAESLWCGQSGCGPQEAQQ